MNFTVIGELKLIGGSKFFRHTLSAAILFGLVMSMSGCFEVKEDPPPAKLSTGTIKGKLTDSMTQQAIVGASVDIGGMAAITDTDGLFTMSNVVVPLDASNNIKAATYKVTIDMRSVTSPVDMVGATATPRYPDFSYDFVSILFSSASSTATTPANYLKENVDFKVGKLAADITGVVADKTTLQAVPAGYTVKLVSLGSTAEPGSTGVSEYIVGSTITNISGGFTFANIESLRNFRIDSWNADRTISGSVNVTAPADGETKTLSVQSNNALLVASIDTNAPIIVSVTPEMNSDIAPVATDVVYTFSKPILQTADTSTSPSVSSGLYNKIDVNFMGAKASNITHSLSWNASFTQLTISIPTLAASSKYTVDLTPADSLLKDLNGTALDNTIDRRLLSFTTNGASMPAAPGTVTVVNNSSLDYSTPTVLLDWLPVSGAKAYNVYRAQNYPSAAGQLQLVGSNPSTLTSDFSDTLPATSYVSGQNKLTYSYVVTSVSADNIESADSAVVTIQDNVAPTATIPTGLASTITITFSEPVDEISATTLTNYILTPGSAAAAPTIVSAVLNAGLTTLTLTLNASTTIGNVLAVTGVKDVAGNVMTSVLATF